jgi:hypothetical protein
LNDLESDVAINGLHESFLNGYFKNYITGFVCLSRNLSGVYILASTEFSLIVFVRRRSQTLISGYIYSLYLHTSELGASYRYLVKVNNQNLVF